MEQPWLSLHRGAPCTSHDWRPAVGGGRLGSALGLSGGVHLVPSKRKRFSELGSCGRTPGRSRQQVDAARTALGRLSLGGRWPAHTLLNPRWHRCTKEAQPPHPWRFHSHVVAVHDMFTNTCLNA